jgi:hypothetical protein
MLRDKMPSAFERLQHNLAHASFHSHFSGCNFDFLGLLFIREALGYMGINIPLMKYLHACDIGGAQLRTILEISPAKGGADHVFVDMLTRLPTEVSRAIHVVQPTAAMRRRDPTAAECGNLRVKAIVDDYHASKFDSSTRCFCKRHLTYCSVYPRAPPNRFVFHSAGTICKDFSPFGCRRGLGGASATCLYVWFAEARVMTWLVLINECAVQFPAGELFATELPEHETMSVVLHPEWFGCPAGRPRRWTVAVLKASVTMRQPVTEAALLSLFGRKMRLKPDCFFVAPKELVARHIARLANLAFIELAAEDVETLAAGGRLPQPRHGIQSFDDLLQVARPGTFERLQGYRAHHKQALDAGTVSPDEALIYDLSQSVERPRIGRHALPALVTKCDFYSAKLGRDLLPVEHMLAQGVRACAVPGDSGSASGVPFQIPWRNLLTGPKALSDAQVKFLAGNGQNLLNVIPVQLFVLSHADVALA